MPTLLTLPRELRFEIYAYLTTPSPLSYPYRHSPISSITHTPPPSALQRTCNFLHSEITAYFYGIAMLRFVAQAFQRGYDDADYAACLRAIRLAKKVEIVLIWNVDRQRARWEEEFWPWNMKGFVEHTVGLLVREGRCLEVLTVSVRDACDEGVGWDVREKMVAPLKDLMGRAIMVLGDVTAAEEKEDDLREWLGQYLRLVNAPSPEDVRFNAVGIA
jgi:hypothetical protein